MGLASVRKERMLAKFERREGLASDMGALCEIANLHAYELWQEHAGPSSRTRFRPAEQGIGREAVGLRLVAMRRHPCYLRLEKGNPGIEFGLRVGAEILARKLARCIASWPRQISFIHQVAASQGNGLAVNP
jgi:hypothetical protein